MTAPQATLTAYLTSVLGGEEAVGELGYCTVYGLVVAAEVAPAIVAGLAWAATPQIA